MDTPVVLAIFNRPDQLEKVFARVAEARPKRLFVVADGPRSDRPGEAERCAEARAVTEQVDWDCHVERNYADQNMGCGRRLSSGYSWVFEHVDRAIIIEDDCVPSPDFFPFMEEMLERYKDDPRVMHVSGRGVFHELPQRQYSYYFTDQHSCWGWGTWARAWQYYDFKVSLWPEVRHKAWLKGIVGDDRAVRFFMDLFDQHYYRNETIRTWAQQWNFACFVQRGLGIRPYANLVEYVGFEDATHKFMWGNKNAADFPVQPLTFPLKHPPCLRMDKEADKLNYDRMFGGLERQRRVHQIKAPLRLAKRAARTVVPRR